jgi:hypothetical protein
LESTITADSGVAALLTRCYPAVGRAFRTSRHEARRIALERPARERALLHAVGALQSVGIDPILIKGWSVSRQYPVAHLRPLGDIDLCVLPQDLERAEDALMHLDLPRQSIDLHAGVPDLQDRGWNELYARSQQVPFHHLLVRILGNADLLRLVCLHWVRHLGVRPLWLVDVALLGEKWGPKLDWDQCLAGPAPQREWVLLVLELARHLLGAEIPSPRIKLPRWLIDTVLWQWGCGSRWPDLHEHFRQPGELPDTVRYRWLNPIRAAVRTGIRPSRPLGVLQAAALLQRPRQIMVRLHRVLGGSRNQSAKNFTIHKDRKF